MWPSMTPLYTLPTRQRWVTPHLIIIIIIIIMTFAWALQYTAPVGTVFVHSSGVGGKNLAGAMPVMSGMVHRLLSVWKRACAFMKHMHMLTPACSVHCKAKLLQTILNSVLQLSARCTCRMRTTRICCTSCSAYQCSWGCLTLYCARWTTHAFDTTSTLPLCRSWSARCACGKRATRSCFM